MDPTNPASSPAPQPARSAAPEAWGAGGHGGATASNGNGATTTAHGHDLATVPGHAREHDRNAPAPVWPLSAPDRDGDGGGSHTWVWVVVVLLVIGLAVAGYFLYPKLAAHLHGDGAAMPPGGGRGGNREIPVVTAEAKQGNLNLYLNALGTVTPYNTVTVRTRVDGEIVKVNFTEGQAVKAGEVLFEIDPRPFQVQLEQAQGNMARDQAQLKSAQQDLKAYMEAGEAAVGKQQIAQQQQAVAQFQGAVKADEGAIHNAELQLTYAHVLAPIDGRIGLRIVDLGNMVHASDANGLAVITQIQPITVVFTIPQDSIPRVIEKPNGGVGMVTEAWNRDFTEKLATGKLEALDSQVDPTTGTLRIKSTFGNENGLLFPSQFVNARLLVDTLKDVILVPAAAVQRGPSFDYVYVVKQGGDKPGDKGASKGPGAAGPARGGPEASGGEKPAASAGGSRGPGGGPGAGGGPGGKGSGMVVELRKIKTGQTEGDRTVIADGVKAGELVVTDGIDKLVDGSKVNPKPGGGGKGGAGAATQPSHAGSQAATRESTTGPARGGGRPAAPKSTR